MNFQEGLPFTKAILRTLDKTNRRMMTWLMTSHDPYGHAPMDMCMHPQHPEGWQCNSFDINKKCKNYPYPLRPWGGSKMHYKCRHRISPGPWNGKQSGLTRQNCTVNKFQALNATNSNHHTDHTNILHTKLESPEKLKIVECNPGPTLSEHVIH